MRKNNLSFLVVRAGAIGGITAALMKRNGSESGIPVPFNRLITDMIHEIEAKKLGISINNFNDPLFDRFNN